MDEELKKLYKRILEISYKNRLSHIGSCLTAVGIIDEIFKARGGRVKLEHSDKRGYYTIADYDKFVLSCGHAGLALYCVIEKYGGRNAEEIFQHHGVHPDRCVECGIDCSTGSLGHGLPIALGMALANRNTDVYCLISDGEAVEGSIGEALRIANQYSVTNLHIYINWNGLSAYQETEIAQKNILLLNLRETNVEVLPFLKGIEAHYKIMSDGEYEQALEILK